jgi:glycerol-3-phosphate dehydrogenase (NAD(P)+)
MRIAVLGAGSWGTTLAILLGHNHHHVSLWGHRADHVQALQERRENAILLPGIPIPASIEITDDLERALHGAEMIVAAIPAQFLRHTAEKIRAINFRRVLIVNVAKGIENDTLMSMSEVLCDVMPDLDPSHIATLSGPSFAEEVARKVPTAVVIASSSLETAKHAQKSFMTPYFRVYSSTDIRGVELAGSIKNCIAIGAGIADGAGFGDNTKAAIMTRATAELSRLGSCFGAQQQTFAGLSGIGDLIATCMSKHSRNRHVGEEIGRGRKLADVLAEMVMVAEGVATTRSVHDLARKYDVELPIVNEVYQVLFNDKDAIAATRSLMTRDAKGEH